MRRGSVGLCDGDALWGLREGSFYEVASWVVGDSRLSPLQLRILWGAQYLVMELRCFSSLSQ